MIWVGIIAVWIAAYCFDRQWSKRERREQEEWADFESSLSTMGPEGELVATGEAYRALARPKPVGPPPWTGGSPSDAEAMQRLQATNWDARGAFRRAGERDQ